MKIKKRIFKVVRSPSEVFLGTGVLKIYKRTPMPKCDFIYICCIFPKDLSIETSLKSGFCKVNYLKVIKVSLLMFDRVLYTAWKVSVFEFFSGAYFPAFRLNTKRYSVFCPNAGKYRPKKTSNTDTFHASNIRSFFFHTRQITSKDKPYHFCKIK